MTIKCLNNVNIQECCENILNLQTVHWLQGTPIALCVCPRIQYWHSTTQRKYHKILRSAELEGVLGINESSPSRRHGEELNTQSLVLL